MFRDLSLGLGLKSFEFSVEALRFWVQVFRVVRVQD